MKMPARIWANGSGPNVVGSWDNSPIYHGTPYVRATVTDPALEACRIIDEAVAEGHESVSALVLHLLSAAEPARSALTAYEEASNG